MKIKLVIILLLFVLFPHYAIATTVTANVIRRVFLVKIGDKTGSSFTIDYAEKQFLITAKHLLTANIPPPNIQIYREGKWHQLTVQAIFCRDEKVDIIAFELPFKISPELQLVPTTAGMVFGQDMFFLGFPYGLKIEDTGINNRFPFPFVKKGILSAFDLDANKNQVLYLDGHNNPGFSGGPIVFSDLNTKELKVAGVVSGYRNQLDRIYKIKNNEKNNLINDKEDQYYTLSNSGILIGYGIKPIIDAISETIEEEK